MSEENTYAIRKDMPNYSLVSKCVAAARSKNYAGMTRQDVDRTLESIAKSVEASEGVSYAEAYEAACTGADGRRLYEMRELLPAEGGEYQPLVKHEISKSEKAELEAANFSKAYSVPIEKARTMVAEFYADLN